MAAAPTSAEAAQYRAAGWWSDTTLSDCVAHNAATSPDKPLINPYITKSGDLQPKTVSAYLDRSRTDPGILHAGDPAVRAFTDRGWIWGGGWHNPIDYQHFEHH